MASSSKSVRPTPHGETTWLPVLLVALALGMLATTIPDRDRNQELILGVEPYIYALAWLIYGCMLGYANRQYSFKLGLLWPPWCVMAVVTLLSVWGHFSFFSFILVCAVATPLVIGCVPVREWLGLFSWAAMAICALCALFVVVFSLQFVFVFIVLQTYAPIAVGLLFGVTTRRLADGHSHFCGAPHIKAVIPRQFSLASIFWLTSFVAVLLTLLLQLSFRPESLAPALVALVIGAVGGMVVVSFEPVAAHPEYDVGEMRQFRRDTRSLLRCPNCTKVSRRVRRHCPHCGAAYPPPEW